MKDELELWYDYFWDPQNQVLKNKLALRDQRTLHFAETRLSHIKIRAIRQNAIPIDKTYDAAHLKTIHRILFEEIYDWAGEYRTVFMSKAGQGFAEVHEIDKYLNNVS